jgi:hypothetical protein
LERAREGRISFSVGFDLTEPVREAIAQIPDEHWVSALAQDGSARDNGEVAEVTDLIDMSGWPRDSRRSARAGAHTPSTTRRRYSPALGE